MFKGFTIFQENWEGSQPVPWAIAYSPCGPLPIPLWQREMELFPILPPAALQALAEDLSRILKDQVHALESTHNRDPTGR